MIHWSAAFVGQHHTNLFNSPEASLWSSTNPSLYFLSVDSVVTSSTTSLSTEALERSPARSSQRVGVLDHRIDVLLLAPVLRLKREWSLALTCASCLQLALLFSCLQLALLLTFFCTCSSLRLGMLFPFFCTCSSLLGKCSFHPLWVRSSSVFSPVSSNLAIFAQTVGFSWSCVRSTASLPSLRLRTLFHVLRVDWWSQHHTLSSSARCACRGCVFRARLLWVVTHLT